MTSLIMFYDELILSLWLVLIMVIPLGVSPMKTKVAWSTDIKLAATPNINK